MSNNYRTSVAPIANSYNSPQGGGGTGGFYDQQDPGQLLRNVVNNFNSKPLEYDPAHEAMYDDPLLQEITTENGKMAAQSDTIYRFHGAGYAVQFLESTRQHRFGLFNDVLQAMLNHFGKAVNPPNSSKIEFANIMKSRLTYTDRIAMNASIWFGHSMMIMLKDLAENQGGAQPQRGNMLRAAESAVSQIMCLEYVRWLYGSKKGKAWLYNMTTDTKETIESTKVRKETASYIFNIFETECPYDSMDTVLEMASGSPITEIVPEMVNQRYRQHIQGQKYYGNGTDEELYSMLYDFRSKNHDPRTPVPLDQEYVRPPSYADPDENLGTNRMDIVNITLKNRNRFNVLAFFKSTCLPNWYMISNADWLLLQKVLKRSPNQRMEESILLDCVRFVHYDFENENEFEGWTSKSIKFTGVDRDMIISDPAKLLPLLTQELSPESKVNAIEARIFYAGKDDEGNDFVLERLRDAGYSYHVVNNVEKFTSESSAKILERMNVAAQHFQQRTTERAAIIMPFEVTGRMLLSSENKVNMIGRYFDLLFNDDNEYKQHSYFSAIEDIRRTLESHQFDAEGDEHKFVNVLLSRLTQDFNSWLINSCGYSTPNMEFGKLAIDHIMEDLDDIRDHLLRTDRVVFDKLDGVGTPLTLMQQLRFLAPAKECDSEDPLVIEENKLTLNRSRNYYSIIMCNESGPQYDTDVPHVVKRSTQPEFFAVLDELEKTLNKAKRSGEDTDIMLYFPLGASTFMVSYSVYDRNTVIMRPIKYGQSYLIPAYR